MNPLNSDIIRYLLFRLRRQARKGADGYWDLYDAREGSENLDASQELYAGLKQELQNASSIDLRPRTKSSWLKVRDHLDDEDMIILVKAFLELDMRALSYLDLSRNRIGETSVIALAEALVEMPALTHLDLSQNRIGEVSVVAIAEVLERGCLQQLTWLDLSQDLNCGAGSGENESYALARALKSGHLSRLRHLGLPPCNMDVVVNALWEGRFGNLSYLQLSGYFSENSNANLRMASKEELFSVIERLPLQHIHLRRCGLTWDVMEEFTRALVSGGNSAESLEHLDLSENSLGVRGVLALGRIMKEGHLSSLQHLILGSCGIEEIYQIRALEEGVLSGNLPNLTHLDLSSNKLGFFGIFSLMKMMEAGRLCYLQHLNLSGCHMRVAAGLETLRPGKPFRLPYLDADERDVLDFIAVLGKDHATQLQHLDLSFNKLGTSGCVALARVIQAGHLPHLHHLHLCACKIKDDGVLALVEAMDAGKLRKLKYLDLGFNKFDRRGVEALSRALKEGVVPDLRFLNVYLFRLRNIPLMRDNIGSLYERIYGAGKEDSWRIASRERDHLVRSSFYFVKTKKQGMLAEREVWIKQMANTFVEAFAHNHDLKATIVGLGAYDAQILESRDLNVQVPVHIHEDASSMTSRSVALTIVILSLGIYLYMV